MTVPRQMADYDRLGARPAFQPYVMFFQQPDFRSEAVNTDRFGFRHSLDRSGQPWSAANPPPGKVNIVTGNSVAFGVGATCDAHSLASRLAHHSGEPWLDFSGRAFSSMQELVLFQAYRSQVESIGRVLVFSGLNDLYLFFAPKLFDEIWGVFFYSDFLADALANGPDLGRKRNLLRAALSPRLGRDYPFATMGVTQVLADALRAKPQAKERLDDAAMQRLIAARLPERPVILRHFQRQMESWAALSDRLGFALDFALQPMLPWLGRMHPEETRLEAHWDGLGSRWHTILRHVLTQQTYEWYTAELAEICHRLGVSYRDINAAVRSQPDCADWLFIDRVHMTDAGYDLSARLLAGG